MSVVVITLVDAKRVWRCSRQGTPVRKTDRDTTCCGEATAHPGVVTVPDLKADLPFRRDPLVQEQRARSYAGAPLTTPDGFRIGVLTVHDQQIRDVTPEEQTFQSDLAAVIVDELELQLMIVKWQRAQQGVSSGQRAPQPGGRVKKNVVPWAG